MTAPDKILLVESYNVVVCSPACADRVVRGERPKEITYQQLLDLWKDEDGANVTCPCGRFVRSINRPKGEPAGHVYYTYKALDGTKMPAVKAYYGDTTFEQAVASVKGDHTGSVTPIDSIGPQLTDPADVRTVIVMTAATLRRLPANQIGRRHSLEWVLKALRLDLARLTK